MTNEKTRGNPITKSFLQTDKTWTDNRAMTKTVTGRAIYSMVSPKSDFTFSVALPNLFYVFTYLQAPNCDVTTPLSLSYVGRMHSCDTQTNVAPEPVANTLQGCCIVVLRPRQTSKVMSGRSFNLTFPGQA